MPETDWSGIEVGDCRNNPVKRCWKPGLGGWLQRWRVGTDLGDV